MALRETLYSPNPASPALSVVFDDMDGVETASIAPSHARGQMHRPLPPATLDLDRIGSQLPPLPTTIPSRLPSLLEEHEGDEYLTEDDDDQSEVDSIFFVNDGEQDALIATSNSLVDLASTNAEAAEDVLGIVARLQNALH